MLPERPAALEMYGELDRLGALGVTRWLDGVQCPLLLVQAASASFGGFRQMM
ncbi:MULTISPECIES: hypothetical protein [unclassified Streptomyces]|uniref:hypothetical protein n=1 Tax=unclassified Streptomyces TaxID=2593676 RepID=UPI0022567909|nr:MULTISPECIES: hypothetical protein [unclassified Streptomyces]WSP56658.1 hypothetical protein OG306_21515 [Streptomyces sp. NBC_01241]WSU22624.1 hypothetical protein OG508_17715 [Streptomyces sp. NBC_01108]MCX4788405.1 hypothetical protein [Streptomyces sp. NBC_01221]MCX4795834.1 hypothetical protein [Streptomyces sp. NBC_01242]WSJ37116.1 hypothetical protein OG772_14420 [Streptomyces sp. NBC_01321]